MHGNIKILNAELILTPCKRNEQDCLAPARSRCRSFYWQHRNLAFLGLTESTQHGMYL